MRVGYGYGMCVDFSTFRCVVFVCYVSCIYLAFSLLIVALLCGDK